MWKSKHVIERYVNELCLHNDPDRLTGRCWSNTEETELIQSSQTDVHFTPSMKLQSLCNWKEQSWWLACSTNASFTEHAHVFREAWTERAPLQRPSMTMNVSNFCDSRCRSRVQLDTTELSVEKMPKLTQKSSNGFLLFFHFLHNKTSLTCGLGGETCSHIGF